MANTALRLELRSLLALLFGVLTLAVFPLPARASAPDEGWVVWASDRQDGRHEIYLMKVDGTGLKRLTRNGGMFPAWSPDGRWIAYQGDGTRIVQPNGAGDEKVCDGQFNFWMWDGSGLVCEVGDDHYLVKPGTTYKERLFGKSDWPMLKNGVFYPRGITRDGRWLVAGSTIYQGGFTGSNGTFKTDRESAVILDLHDRTKVYFFGIGCQPTTPPWGSLVYHVCGKGPCPYGPDIFRMNLDDLSTRSSYEVEVAHADADWGHEYFPRISNDNEWMTYAATTGCHDQVNCDYEVFVHRLGKKQDRTRITHHPRNDFWPHLWVGPLPGTSPCTGEECDPYGGDIDASGGCSMGSRSPPALPPVLLVLLLLFFLPRRCR